MGGGADRYPHHKLLSLPKSNGLSRGSAQIRLRFLAGKDNGDREGALKCFTQAYEAYQRFQKALEDLREVIRSTGDDAVTVI